MRVVNRTIVANTIREHAPLSRAYVARLTSISPPTVSAIVAELIREGLVKELSQEPFQVGRPPRTPTLRFSELGPVATIVGGAFSVRSAPTESTHIMGATGEESRCHPSFLAQTTASR
jgi:Winged helix-turn-helix DNA-binding